MQVAINIISYNVAARCVAIAIAWIGVTYYVSGDSMGRFIDKLEKISKKNKSLLCVGLDPHPDQVPVSDIFEFNKAIIENTQHLVCAYKPNLGFVPGGTGNSFMHDLNCLDPKDAMKPIMQNKLKYLDVIELDVNKPLKKYI